MRLFGAIQDNFKKVEAAEICKNLLEEHKSKGRFFDDPTSAAMELVWACWISYEHYFDGRHGQRAHKLALAAFAFANAVRVLRQGYNSDVFCACIITIMAEAMSKKDLYPFSNLDFKIFDEVTTIIMPVLEQHEQTYRTLKGGLGMPSDNVEKAKDIVRTGYQEYLTSASAKAVEKIMGDEPTKTDALEKNNKFEKPAVIVSLEAKIDDLRQKNRRQKPTLL